LEWRRSCPLTLRAATKASAEATTTDENDNQNFGFGGDTACGLALVCEDIHSMPGAFRLGAGPSLSFVVEERSKPMRIPLMTKPKTKPIHVWRQNLYIEPTSVCNLHCKMCYTNVINGAGRKVLPQDVILSFVDRFRAVTPPPIDIYWCGTGE